MGAPIDFIACEEMEEGIPGYEFRTGPSGRGYYKKPDPAHTTHPYGMAGSPSLAFVSAAATLAAPPGTLPLPLAGSAALPPPVLAPARRGRSGRRTGAAHIVARSRARALGAGVGGVYGVVGAVPHSDIALTVRVDMTRPCQSLKGYVGDAAAEIKATLLRTCGTIPVRTGPGGGGSDAIREMLPCAAYCFQTMIEREQEHHGDFYVFYHSYSHAALLYEVQAEFARHLYGLPDDFAPMPRILKGAFHSKPTMDMLLEDFSKMAGRDHDPAFRALAVSASVSLFAPTSEAPPLTCFVSGYSCTDLSFRNLLVGLLKKCGVTSDAEAESMTDKLADIAQRYGIPHTGYAKPSGRNTYAGIPAPVVPQGHMLQIFVHKDYVDEVAYASHAFGVRSDPGPISGALGRATRCDGQARVFVHPDLFTDARRAILYHYCASPELCSMAAGDGHDSQGAGEAPRTRGAFIHEMRRVLAPIVGSLEGLQRAKRGVEGH